MQTEINQFKLIIMKKVFPLILFISVLYQSNAQYVVSAPTLEGQVLTQTRTQQTQNNEILKELKSINNNLIENKKIQEEIKNIKTREEDDLLKVPVHIKTGTTMNGILTKEGNILKKIKMLIDIANNPSFKRSDIESFINPIMKLTSMNVDDAIKLCTDNVFRMQPSERQKNLENLNVNLSNLESKLSNKLYEYQDFLSFQKESNLNNERFDEMKKRKIIIKQKN
jgi:hypothetical protein